MTKHADPPGSSLSETKAVTSTARITTPGLIKGHRHAMIDHAVTETLAKAKTVTNAETVAAPAAAEVAPVAAALAAEPSFAEAMAATSPLAEGAELTVAEPARLADQAVDTTDGVFDITAVWNRRCDHDVSRPGVNGCDLARNHGRPTSPSRGPRTGSEGGKQNNRQRGCAPKDETHDHSLAIARWFPPGASRIGRARFGPAPSCARPTSLSVRR